MNDKYKSPPQWIREEVAEHYGRIAEGVENKPHEGIAEMLWEIYDRGKIEGYNLGYSDAMDDGISALSKLKQA